MSSIESGLPSELPLDEEPVWKINMDIVAMTHAVDRGPGSISELRIDDVTPGFTSTQVAIACPATLPASLSSCTVQVPATLDNVIGYEGWIEWRFVGTLAAGARGELWFDVIVE